MSPSLESLTIPQFTDSMDTFNLVIRTSYTHRIVSRYSLDRVAMLIIRAENFQDGMKSLGVTQSQDQAGSALGVFWSPNSIDPKNMTRSYSRSAYYDNFVTRQNLHVYTSRQVTKLITEDDDEESGKGVKISGVEVSFHHPAKPPILTTMK